MTACPHCKKKLFHEQMESDHWVKKPSFGPTAFERVNQYLFRCACTNFPNLNNTIPGYSKTVDEQGNLIHIEIVNEKYCIMAIHQATQRHGLNYTPGTCIYAMKDHKVKGSPTTYKDIDLIIKLEEIKDLSSPNLESLNSWCATLSVFS